MVSIQEVQAPDEDEPEVIELDDEPKKVNSAKRQRQIAQESETDENHEVGSMIKFVSCTEQSCQDSLEDQHRAKPQAAHKVQKQDMYEGPAYDILGSYSGEICRFRWPK